MRYPTDSQEEDPRVSVQRARGWSDSFHGRPRRPPAPAPDEPAGPVMVQAYHFGYATGAKRNRPPAEQQDGGAALVVDARPESTPEEY